MKLKVSLDYNMSQCGLYIKLKLIYKKNGRWVVSEQALIPGTILIKIYKCGKSCYIRIIPLCDA
jgi:hypothetical protein